MSREILDSRFIEFPVRREGRIFPQPPAVKRAQSELVEEWTKSHPDTGASEVCISTGPQFTDTRQGYSVRLEKVIR